MIALLEAGVSRLKYLRMRRAVAPLERQLEKEIAAAFRSQGTAFARAYNQARDSFREAAGPDAITQLFDIIAMGTRDLLAGPIESAGAKALEASGKQQTAEFGVQVAFGLKNPRAVEWLRQHAAERVADINDTTRKEIAGIVTRGIEADQTYDQIAKEIGDRFGEFGQTKQQAHIQTRAHLVAVTEIGDAYERGNRFVVDEIEAQGIDIEKHWRNSGDGRVSAGCLANSADGWIPLNQPHTSGHQEPLRFPGCRCWEEYRRKASQ